MSTKPDVVIPPGLPPDLRQVLTAINERLRRIEEQLDTKISRAETAREIDRRLADK